MKNYIILVSIFAILGISACQSHNEEHHSENKFLVTTLHAKVNIYRALGGGWN